MTASASVPVNIAGPVSIAALEFKAFEYPPTGALSATLPAAPGAVGREGTRAVMLHAAPGGYFAPDPSEACARDLAALAAAGAGALFDVTGKYQHLRLSGPRAMRVLAEAIDVAAVLAGRECAAVMLFDSPAVIACDGAGYDVWVEASYAEHFRGMLDEITHRLESR